MAWVDPITRARVGAVDVQRDGVTVALVQNERGLFYREWRRDGQVMSKREVDEYFGIRPRAARFSLRRVFAALRGWAICKGQPDGQ